jgi:hypothetical protein
MQEINPSHTKQCKRCKRWLHFNKFSPHAGAKDKLQTRCKECRNKHANSTHTLEKGRINSLGSKFNITIKQYEKMLLDQNGVCYICKQPETAKSNTGKIRTLAVDHNHETGELRMLLCHNCNLTLGIIETNISRLEDFLGYLEEMKNRESEEKIVQFPLLIE